MVGVACEHNRVISAPPSLTIGRRSLTPQQVAGSLLKRALKPLKIGDDAGIEEHNWGRKAGVPAVVLIQPKTSSTRLRCFWLSSWLS